MSIVNNPISNVNIQNKINCNFVLYEDIHKYKNIKELVGNGKKTLILYQLARIGHFTCVFENEEGINFFDPLGYMPDSLLSKIEMGKHPLHHDYTYLIKLLLTSNRPVIYNEYKLQKSSTSTCGHWCAIRMLCSDLYCDEFAGCFHDVRDRDKTIVKIYNDI